MSVRAGGAGTDQIYLSEPSVRTNADSAIIALLLQHSCRMAMQDIRDQGRLAAEAEQHARNTADRDRFMRRVAAQTGIMQLPGLYLHTCCDG